MMRVRTWNNTFNFFLSAVKGLEGSINGFGVGMGDQVDGFPPTNAPFPPHGDFPPKV
jgi:hypothetical protein